MSEALRDNDPTPFPRSADFLGHPKPLWLLFATEFWERFAYYGMRALLAVYVASTFFALLPDGEAKAQASLTYGAYTALIYATGIFGGFIADRYLGYRPSILLGGTIMALGLFLLLIPDLNWFLVGLAVIVVGNGLFKPNISTMVGMLYAQNDARRDSGFTIFYMGINLGAMIAPILTGWLAERMFGGSPDMPAYKIVFIASAIGMVISLIWFWFGRHQLRGVGLPPAGGDGLGRLAVVAVGALAAIPVFFFLLTIEANTLQVILMALFVIPAGMLLVEGVREGKVARDMVIAMLIIFVFNVLFWMFFEQAGASFNFLAQNIVNREFGDWTFPVGWFQSVNSVAIITLAPVLAWLWVRMGRNNPSIPRKFGLGLIFNGLAFLLLVVALSSMVDGNGKIPFWTLFMVYVIQSIGELCLSPIGLSMTTKLAPARVTGLAMGCWFLSIAIGNNLAGIFAGKVSGESGMTVASAQAGYNFGFWALVGAGVLLFLVAPLIQRLMHGVK